MLHRVTTVRQVPPGGGTVERARRVGAPGARPGPVGTGGVWPRRPGSAARRCGSTNGRRRPGTGPRRHSSGPRSWPGCWPRPDAASRTVRLADGASGTLVVSDRQDRAVFLASGMAEPPAGKVYQLWFDDHGTMRSAG